MQSDSTDQLKTQGCYIGRSYHKEEVKQVERRAEKRKIEATSTTPSAAAAVRPSTTPGKVRFLQKENRGEREFPFPSIPKNGSL